MWVLKLHDDTPLGAPDNPEQAYTTFLDSNLNGIKDRFFPPGEHTHTHTLGKCLYTSVWGTLASISRYKSKYFKKVFYEIESQNFWFEKNYCGAHS